MTKGRPGEDDPNSTRNTIMAAAAKLFATKGVALTTVRDIGREAGLLSGSLYYHFPSKEDLVKEIVIEFIRELNDRYRAVLEAHERGRDRLEGLIRSSFEAIEEHRHACQIFQNEYTYLRSLPMLAEFDSLNDETQRIWLATIEQGITEKELRDDVEPKVFYRFARDAIWFTARWYQPGSSRRIEDLATSATTVFLDGFARREG